MKMFPKWVEISRFMIVEFYCVSINLGLSLSVMLSVEAVCIYDNLWRDHTYYEICIIRHLCLTLFGFVYITP